MYTFAPQLKQTKQMKQGKVYFVSGIDTNIGKTYATGAIARAMAEAGCSVITQKMIQTGCLELSEDIEMHRCIQGIPLLEEDLSGLTCPYLYSYPCSPHMAAEEEGRPVDLDRITEATKTLQERYDYVLLEGAGGLMVPIDRNTLTIDYLQSKNYPLILVTSGKLGSINHTLLSLDACRQRGIEVAALVYNLYPSIDAKIEAATLDYLQTQLPGIPLILLTKIEEDAGQWPDVRVLI